MAKCLAKLWLQGEGMQFGHCFPSISLNANSDPLHVCWSPSATILLPVIRLLVFPPRAELSEHGSGDKDSLLLKPTTITKSLALAVHCEPGNYLVWSREETYEDTFYYRFFKFPLFFFVTKFEGHL